MTQLFGGSSGPAFTEDGWKYAFMIKKGAGDWGTTARDATSTHFVMQQAWDMYAQTFGHNGLRNHGGEVRVLVNVTNIVRTAFLEGQSKDGIDFFQFSKLDGQLTCTYDHAGHEFSHGINKYSRHLELQSEAGALGEGFGDIFAVMTERFSRSGSWDWVVGGDLTSPRVRDLANPTTVPFRSLLAPPLDTDLTIPAYYPAMYKSTYWYNGDKDDGGVHINSSVLGKWFHLLSVGGTQNSVTVTGIGIDKAAQIAWHSFRNLLASDENYPKCREHTITSAKVLFGNCSFEVAETCKAWKAVRIGQLCDCAIGHPLDPCRNSQQFRVALNTPTLAKDVKVFPNPANDLINVSFKELTQRYNGFISISSIDGRQVIDNVSFNEGERIVTIDISSLSPGVYIVRLVSNNEINNYKFVKE